MSNSSNTRNGGLGGRPPIVSCFRLQMELLKQVLPPPIVEIVLDYTQLGELLEWRVTENYLKRRLKPRRLKGGLFLREKDEAYTRLHVRLKRQIPSYMTHNPGEFSGYPRDLRALIFQTYGAEMAQDTLHRCLLRELRLVFSEMVALEVAHLINFAKLSITQRQTILDTSCMYKQFDVLTIVIPRIPDFTLALQTIMAAVYAKRQDIVMLLITYCHSYTFVRQDVLDSLLCFKMFDAAQVLAQKP